MKIALALSAMTLLSAQQSEDELITRAAQALKATGFSHSATTSGKSYRIVFDHADKRQQTIYMAQKPQVMGEVITYNFYTTVWSGKTAPDLELMKKCFTKVKKLGAFYLFKDSNDVWVIRFQVKFDATDLKGVPTATDPLIVQMKDMIYFVDAVGEETDKELNGDIDNK